MNHQELELLLLLLLCCFAFETSARDLVGVVVLNLVIISRFRQRFRRSFRLQNHLACDNGRAKPFQNLGL